MGEKKKDKSKHSIVTFADEHQVREKTTTNLVPSIDIVILIQIKQLTIVYCNIHKPIEITLPCSTQTIVRGMNR